MKKFSLIISNLLIVLFVSAQDIAYYQNQAIEGKSQGALKTALHTLINTHHNVGYDGLYNVYQTSDNKNGQIWDMYSTCSFPLNSQRCGNYSGVCDCYNREHMIPQSWFGKASPMVSDAFHVYPTDGKVNGMRSNHPHGETNAAPMGGMALGKLGACSVPGYSGTVYEPDDQYKGDIARTYFYFATCYENYQFSVGESARVFANNAYPGFQKWFLDLMLKWHRQDPVSQKEIDRNNAVFVHQNNRNPFIDYPALVDHIWGDKKNEPFYFSNQPIGPEINEYVITVLNQTIYIQGLKNNELIQIVDATGNIIYQTTTTCTNHNYMVPYAGQYQVKIDGTPTGGTLDIK